MFQTTCLCDIIFLTYEIPQEQSKSQLPDSKLQDCLCVATSSNFFLGIAEILNNIQTQGLIIRVSISQIYVFIKCIQFHGAHKSQKGCGRLV